jgi:glucokinase
MIEPPATAPCLAIDFGGSKVAIALFNDAGEIESQERINFGSDATAASILEATARVCQPMVAERKEIAVGVVSPGVIRADHILLAPNVTGWSDIALERWASEVFPARTVSVGNDVKAAAAAEATWGALQGCNPGLYVNLGTGIAAAVVINGHVVFGATGAAGEIGYNSVSRQDGVLEDIVGARSIVRRAQALGFDCLDASEVFLAMGSVSRVSSLIDEVIGEVAVQLRSIIHLIDPARVVVGGGLSASAALFLPRLRASLNIRTGAAPDISVARFETASSLHGARLLGLNASQQRSVEVLR